MKEKILALVLILFSIQARAADTIQYTSDPVLQLKYINEIADIVDRNGNTLYFFERIQLQSNRNIARIYGGLAETYDSLSINQSYEPFKKIYCQLANNFASTAENYAGRASIPALLTKVDDISNTNREQLAPYQTLAFFLRPARLIKKQFDDSVSRLKADISNPPSIYKPKCELTK